MLTYCNGGLTVPAALAGYLPIDIENTSCRDVPRKFLRLLISSLFQLLAQRLIQQNPLQRPHDVEHVLWIHHHGCLAHYFRQRRGVGSHHWGPVGHCLQGGQSESFIKRREDKDLGRVVKNAKYLNGNKSQKAHVVR